MSLIGKVMRRLLPRPIGTSLSSFKILESDYGHAFSSLKRSAIDKNNNPLPWYTYPAIEYLKQFDYSQKSIFEYGSGNSSIFWSQLAKKVVSIEDNEAWYTKVLEKISKYELNNCNLKYIPKKEDYINEILLHENFDLIIIDGQYRNECVERVFSKLNPGGLIILDNSDWWTTSAQLLREFDVIQIDMKGFGPINHYTWTTSLFLHRQFDFSSKSINQPEHGIGSLQYHADK